MQSMLFMHYRGGMVRLLVNHIWGNLEANIHLRGFFRMGILLGWCLFSLGLVS